MTHVSESKKNNKTQHSQQKDYGNAQQIQQKDSQPSNLFEFGYRDLMRQDAFWLEGKTTKEIKIIMEKYVNDFQLSYGILPAWYTKSLSNTSEDLDKINLHNFRIEMKFIHDRG